jgi:hypothetical protein
MEPHRPQSNFKPRFPTQAPCRFVPYEGGQPPDDPDEIPWHQRDGVWMRIVGDGVNPNGTPRPPPPPPKPKAPYKPRKTQTAEETTDGRARR